MSIYDFLDTSSFWVLLPRHRFERYRCFLFSYICRHWDKLLHKFLIRSLIERCSPFCSCPHSISSVLWNKKRWSDIVFLPHQAGHPKIFTTSSWFQVSTRNFCWITGSISREKSSGLTWPPQDGIKHIFQFMSDFFFLYPNWFNRKSSPRHGYILISWPDL